MSEAALVHDRPRAFRKSLRRAGALAGLVCLTFAGRLAATPQACGFELEYGMNPSFHTWSSRAIVLADAMTRARTFTVYTVLPGTLLAGEEATPIPRGQRPALLGEGWPDPATLKAGERFGTLIFGSMDGTVPDGREKPYVVVWEGDGNCSLAGPFVVGEQNRSEQRVEYFIDPTAGQPDAPLLCVWTARDPADPVRNVRVWLPGMENSGQLFWPPFLAKARLMNAGHGPYGWRTLEWTRVNECGKPLGMGGYVLDVDGAITPQSPSQGTVRGMCPEYQVAFCNAMRCHLHFLVPHRTDDLSEGEYRLLLERKLLAIRDGSPAVPGLNGDRPFAGLDPDLKVTLELSNEMWNPGFPVHAWMEAEAARKGISIHAQIASEMALVFDVARSVFSGPHAGRLETFVGGWIADPGFVDRILRALPPGTQVDALGPAGYFGPRPDDIDVWLTDATSEDCPNCPSAATILATARDSIELLRPLIARHRTIADAWDNPDGTSPALVLYEAGQGFQARFRPYFDAAQAAQSLPEMYDAYAQDLVPMFVDEGVDVVHWYSFMTDQESGLVDPWGIWDTMEQTISLPAVDAYVDRGAPKAAAICQGPPLASSCTAALAVFRNAGSNPACYTTTRPILGSTLRARVDLRPTGHRFALVVGSLRRTQASVLDGATLLVTGSSRIIGPVRPGPLVDYEMRIPNDPAIAGFKLMTQALLYGGAKITLSNAQDLRLGRR